MPTGTGITSDTPISLAIGAGVFLRDHAFIGPTVDNNLFAVDREIFTPQLNGIKGMLMSTDYIVRSEARIEATVPQVNADVLSSSIPGSTVDTGTPGMTVISEDDERRLDDNDYHDYELDLERPNGGQFQFEVDNAIQTSGFEGELTDDGLFAPRLVMAARWAAGALTAAPWRIRILDTAS